MQMRYASRFSLLLLAFVAAMILFPAMAFAETVAPDGTTGASTPTIQSDQDDYSPGSTVTLTGTGWQPGESVHINVNDNDGQTWSRDVDVTADANGDITDQFQLPNSFVAVYSVKATGASGAVATTSFTDASLTVLRGPTGNPPNVTFTVNWQKYSNNTCTTLVTNGGNLSGSQVISTDNPGSLGGFGNDGPFVKLTVPTTATSPSGYAFDNWDDAAGSDNSIASSSNTSICVRNPSGPQNDIYRATYKVTDSTPPVITPNVQGTLGSNGWYTSNVTVSWTVNDPDSSVTSQSGCGPTTISSDTTGQTLTCTATSADGTKS